MRPSDVEDWVVAHSEAGGETDLAAAQQRLPGCEQQRVGALAGNGDARA
jgi:hypothetical protein